MSTRKSSEIPRRSLRDVKQSRRGITRCEAGERSNLFARVRITVYVRANRNFQLLLRTRRIASEKPQDDDRRFNAPLEQRRSGPSFMKHTR